MLGLRYLACPDCDTVYALPDDDAGCCRCGADRLAPIRTGAAAAAYFSPAVDDESGE